MRSLPAGLASLLDCLAESEDVTALDLALARMLAEHDPERGHEVALGVALASSQSRAGHSAVALADWAGGAFPGTAARLPEAEAWADALSASPTVGAPGDGVRPLVLDGGWLALRRLWDGERRVARALAARLGTVAVDAEALATAFTALFPEAAAGDRQALAAAGALRHRLAVVAGGPGTGKTTTVAKILALLLAADPGLEIALAAPTGKASDRLGRSVAERVAGLPVSDEVKARVPTEAATLHRLLRYSPSRRRFRRDAESPVPADVVVVDETSMADLALFDALLGALRPGARLILLGDADQLPSVGAGAVFGDVCAAGASEAVSPGFAAFAESLGLDALPTSPDAGPLADAVVRLTVSHRFSEGSGIGALARALRDGDGGAVRDVLAPDAVPDVVCRPASAEAVWAHVGPHARRLCTATNEGDALDAAAAFRLLAPTRGGRWGVRALTAAVERRLSEEGLRRSPWDRWYHGRPVLVTANDYDRGLYNGDVGVVWHRGPGPVVLFEAGDEVREVPVATLPEHETAWAMTVHKSQGSEFGHVGFVLPAAPEAERLTRALAYTAVTRAKAQAPGGPPPLTVLGSADALADAAARSERRTGTLAARLAEAVDAPVGIR